METTQQLTYAPQGMVFLTPAKGVQSPELEAQAIHEALGFWAFLACRTHTDEQDETFDQLVEETESFSNLDEIRDWAQKVFDFAYECEKDMCPVSDLKDEENILTFEWVGTFTQGRWYRLFVYETAGQFEAYMAWDTGKDVPSTYLDKIQNWWDIPGVVTDDRHSS